MLNALNLGWMCVPLAVESYGAWGVKAGNALILFFFGKA